MIWNKIIVRDVRKIYKLAIKKLDLKTALNAQKLLVNLHISQIKHNLELIAENKFTSHISEMDEKTLETLLQDIEHQI